MSRIRVACVWCHIVHERFASQAKSKHIFCNKTCQSAYELHQNRLKRHKVCKHCNAEYCDVTKRNLHNTCDIVCQKASMTRTRHKNGTYGWSEEQKEKARVSVKATYASRDVFGPELRKKFSETMKKTWRDGKIDTNKHWTKTTEGKAHLSKLSKGVKRGPQPKMSLGAQRRVRTKRETMYTSAKGGHREDLNMYFRSMWEANFARILNFKNLKWEYEKKSFQLEPSFSYTPDFYVVEEDVFYELKGRMDDKSKRQLELMAKVFPNVTVHVIDGAKYAELRVQFKHLVDWEGK